MSLALLIGKVQEAFPALARLEPAALETVRRHGYALRAAAGEHVFRSGDGCEGLTLLVEGRVRVSLASEAGRELVLYRVRPGETCIVTAHCLLGASPYPADGLVESPLLALALPRLAFRALVESSPRFRDFVFAVFGARLVELVGIVQEVAFRKLDARLARRLLELGPEVALSHQQLADELGTTREIVSRLLESWADDGVVRLARRRVELLDRGALLGRADGG